MLVITQGVNILELHFETKYKANINLKSQTMQNDMIQVLNGWIPLHHSASKRPRDRCKIYVTVLM